VKLAYRPEIDGLRTIAVLAVIVYHLDVVLGDVLLLKGGFLGVDIFFVISGFLITSIIMSEYHNTQGFSLVNFYERRARRLLPALFVVILASLPVAWYLLLPSQLEDFSKSILSTLAFGSNFYWNISLQEYGAESAQLKPFLHTWTLAVEEQYYILFPLMLLAIYKWCKSHTVEILLALLLLSLLLSEYMTPIDHSFSFYMLPTRFWELLAGSLLANALHYHPKDENDTLLEKTMPMLGLVLIVYSIFFVDFESNHPGFITLLPVAGTVLIIWFGSERELVTKILSSKAFVKVGLISYSLYLWHYPIFAFGRLIDSSPIWLDKIQWLALTLVFSLLSYFYIEKPCRKQGKIRSSRFVLYFSLLFIFIVIAMVCVLKFEPEGYKSAQLKELYGKNTADNKVLSRERVQYLQEMARASGYKKGVVTPWKLPIHPYASEELWFKDESKRNVLVVGNSHGRDFFNALHLNREKTDFEFAWFPLGGPEQWSHQVEALLQSPNYIDSDVVIISTKYTNKKTILNENYLPALLEEFNSDGKSVALTSNTPEFETDGTKTIFDVFIEHSGGIFTQKKLNSEYFDGRTYREDNVNKDIEALARRFNLKYFNKSDYACNEAEKMCYGVTAEGRKNYTDGHHYSLAGAKFFGEKILELGWLSRKPFR